MRSGEIRANHLNKGVYVHFRGQKTLVSPGQRNLSLTEINERLTTMMAAEMADTVTVNQTVKPTIQVRKLY